jgi:hypothetical protein
MLKDEWLRNANNYMQQEYGLLKITAVSPKTSSMPVSAKLDVSRAIARFFVEKHFVQAHEITKKSVGVVQK